MSRCKWSEFSSVGSFSIYRMSHGGQTHADKVDVGASKVVVQSPGER